ncbi:hypothetical protein BBP40_005940 [Aspergillus hancockii]|nr:hypothetical protein BBP40_005940 [Aspergillus hancockii]
MDRPTLHTSQDRPPLKRRRESSPVRGNTAVKPPDRPASDPEKPTDPQPPERRGDDDQHAPAAESFNPLIQELQRLSNEDPQLAAQAARLVGLYRRLWESYIIKHADHQRLRKANEQLQVTNVELRQEKGQVERRHADQEAQLDRFCRAFHAVHEGITQIVESLKEVTPEGSAEPPVKPTQGP